MFDLEQQRKDLQAVMNRLDFPADAQETFLNVLDCIAQDKTAAAWFSCILQQYQESEQCAYKQMLTDVIQLGKVLDIHEYTITMLMYLCMAEKLRSRYEQRGISEEIYDRSMADLRYKLEECRLVYGINGTFDAPWLYGFFDLSRFALGRLEFEVITTTQDYTVAGEMIPAGSKAINIHIPRSGVRLAHEEVLKSYKRAVEMFGAAFENQPIVFTCYSWLLDPWNITVLSPTSNLAAFFNDFQIVGFDVRNDYKEVWRLFDCQYTGDVAKLPRDSSLRRAYADRIARGEPVAWATGMFLYRDGKILS